jgi:phosphinothricin acetyltransferase
MSPIIRPATRGDLPAINDIYNHYVLHSTCTYQEEPSTMPEREGWFDAHGREHPVTVLELDGQVAGWGSLSRFHARSAYRFSAENSVYVHHDLHRRGIGAALLQDLLRRATELQLHTIIAGIDTEQAPSIALHRKFGFIEVARLKEFGRWLDVIYMQKLL